MATISQESLEEFKAIFKRKYNYEFKSDEEAKEAAGNLMGYVEILLEIAHREHLRKQRLKKESKGFYLEEDGKVYNCLICYKYISGREGWWDLNGQKCLDCQRAVDSGIIPASLCRDRDSWYAGWELKSKFNIHPTSVKKLTREGKLKVRLLTTENGTIYFQVFLKKENPYLLKLKET